MSVYDNGVSTLAASDSAPDQYRREMQFRLKEWHSRPLEPRLRGSHYLPLIMFTVLLPIAALIGGWFM